MSSPHNHGHSHGSGGCGGHGGHGHGQAGLNGEEFGIQYSLYQRIDLLNVSCLNEEVENSGRDVFKPWEERKNRDKVRFQNTNKKIRTNSHQRHLFRINNQCPN